MRGESRRCRGSIEPLLKLPDGALATRRIVLFFGALLRRRRAAQSCGPCAARAAVRARAAHQKGVQQPLTCKAVQAARSAGGAFTDRLQCLSLQTSDADMILSSPLALPYDAAFE